MVLMRLILSFAAAAILAGVAAPAPRSSRMCGSSESPVRVAGNRVRSRRTVAVTVTAGKTKLRKAVIRHRRRTDHRQLERLDRRRLPLDDDVARAASGRVALWREVANDCGPPIGRL